MMKIPLISLLLCGLCLQASDRPNIVFCMSDDMGYGDVGYNGNTIIQTPELDAMAAETLRLPVFHSAAPNCSPTRATCLTGRAHYRTGLSDHSQPIDATEVSIADALASVGYRTGHFGKWHLGEVDATSPNPGDLGFDTWRATRNNEAKVDPEKFFRDGRRSKDQEGEASVVLMDMALQFIEDAARDRQPFYVNIWFHTPHTPIESTPEYLALYEGMGYTATEQAYYAMMTAMDGQIGRLRDELRRMGIADNTLLVFTSDNGPAGPGSSGGLNGRKNSMKEGGTRVSALFEWPGELPAASVNPVVASSHDLFPTFLAAAGIDSFGPARTIDGQNLIPLLKNGDTLRDEPARFYHSGRPKVVLPDGTHSEDPSIDPGYNAWLTGVQTDFNAARARIALQLASSQPVADAGADLIVVDDTDEDGSEDVVLDASGSSDADGVLASHTWWWDGHRVSGATPTVSLPPGAHELHLRVEDDTGITDDDSVSIFVKGERDGVSPHIESGGRIVIEAEHYGWTHRRRSAVAWRMETAEPGHVGDGYMALPNQGSDVPQTWSDPAATLFYPLEVSTAGTYTLWLRRNVPDGNSINVMVGVDGAEVTNRADNNNSNYGQWIWINAGPVTLPAGEPVLMIRQRQDGYRIDRMILERNSGFSPAGDGPGESDRRGAHSFDGFIQQYPSLSTADQQPDANPDGDELTNEQEFLTGTDPTVADDPPPVTWTWSRENGQTVLEATHVRRRGQPPEGGEPGRFTFEGLQHLPDQDWNEVTAAGLAGLETVGLPLALDPEREEVRTRIVPDLENGDALFFRLGMESMP